MVAILTNLRYAVTAGFVLALVMFVIYLGFGGGLDYAFQAFFFRWLHVLSGVMWIGLLWYFNFVQIPSMPKIPDEQKPAISKVIAPEALWWFRWAAMATIITGLIVGAYGGYLLEALTLGALNGFAVGKEVVIGLGMWLGIIMWFNVWFVIWPKQKIALGIQEASPEAKAAAARTAMLFSRANTILSAPMLFAMVSAQNLF